MNANRKSDEFVVPATPVNNDAAEASAESAEGRDSAKRNAEQDASHVRSEPDPTRVTRTARRAGVSEEGEWSETKVGTPQGAVISPLLANVCLHYVLDLWIQWWRKRHCRGDVVIVRYADDFVIGFESRHEAQACLDALRERLAKFRLKLHDTKTRLIEFGRFAAERRRERGDPRPETFDFLGFTHQCGKTRSRGWFTIQRTTIAKRMRTDAGCHQAAAPPADAPPPG